MTAHCYQWFKSGNVLTFVLAYYPSFVNFHQIVLQKQHLTCLPTPIFLFSLIPLSPMQISNFPHPNASLKTLDSHISMEICNIFVGKRTYMRDIYDFISHPRGLFPFSFEKSVALFLSSLSLPAFLIIPLPLMNVASWIESVAVL